MRKVFFLLRRNTDPYGYTWQIDSCYEVEWSENFASAAADEEYFNALNNMSDGSIGELINRTSTALEGMRLRATFNSSDMWSDVLCVDTEDLSVEDIETYINTLPEGEFYEFVEKARLPINFKAK